MSGSLVTQLLVHADTAALAEFHARHLRQLRLRADADAEDDDVRRQRLAGRRLHLERAVRHPREASCAVVQHDVDTVLRQMPLDVAGHLEVHRRHELVAALHDGDVQPQCDEVLGHLEADEPAADHHRPPLPPARLRPGVGVQAGWLGEAAVDPRPHVASVGYRPDREDARQVDARQRRPDRRRAGREYELVVVLGGQRAGSAVLELDGLVLRGDADHLTTGTAVDGERLAKGVRRRQQQAGLLRDHAAHVVRQTAVGVGDVGSPLHQDDLRLLVQPAQAGGARSPARDSSDDDDLHGYPFHARGRLPTAAVTGRSSWARPWAARPWPHVNHWGTTPRPVPTTATRRSGGHASRLRSGRQPFQTVRPGMLTASCSSPRTSAGAAGRSARRGRSSRPPRRPPSAHRLLRPAKLPCQD